MDEIRREAMNDYEQRTEEQKQYALDFFKAMDSDGNGNISIQEFVAFLRQNGFYNDNFYTLFTELDKDNDGTLDYEELITLFFIVNHDKYRDRLAATSSNVNNNKETKDEITSNQDRSGGPNPQALLDLFIKLCSLGANITNIALAGGCSIM